MLSHLAHLEHKSLSSLVRGLVFEALEILEDFYFSKMAAEIDKKNVRTYNHDEAWK